MKIRRFPLLRKVLDLARYPNGYVKFTPRVDPAPKSTGSPTCTRCTSGSTTHPVRNACCGATIPRPSSATSAAAQVWTRSAATWRSATRRTSSGTVNVGSQPSRRRSDSGSCAYVERRLSRLGSSWREATSARGTGSTTPRCALDRFSQMETMPTRLAPPMSQDSESPT